MHLSPFFTATGRMFFLSFQNSLIYCSFSFHCETAFSTTPESEDSLAVENQGRFKTGNKIGVADFNASFENIKHIREGAVKKAKSL